MNEQEFVLAVPRNKLFGGKTIPDGFHTTGVQELVNDIYNEYKFLMRRDAEFDPSFKQIIPYTVVTCGKSIFLLKRSCTQDEKRLHNKYSIGVGGHINPVPMMTTGIIEKSLRRELNEELVIPIVYRHRLVGFINDDSNDVGSVHLGLVYQVVPETSNIHVRETNLMSGSFQTVAEIKKYQPLMESWSQLVFERINLFTEASTAARRSA